MRTGLSCRHAARPGHPRDRRPRRPGRLRRLAGRHPRPAYALGARSGAALRASRWCSARRASRSAAASCCTMSPPRPARGADRRTVRADLRPRSRRRACRPRSRSPARIRPSASDFASGSPCRRFRIYLSDDVVGAEIGGAVKNVLAIACGVVEGSGLGQNARAALIARGFAEMTRFGLARARGAKRWSACPASATWS